MTTTTIAEQRATEAMGTSGGGRMHPRQEAILRRGARVERLPDCGRRYVYEDGSSILSPQGGAWDVALPCGECWVGGGHTEECAASATSEE